MLQILMVLKHLFSVNFPVKRNQFLVLVLKFFLKILLIILFYGINFNSFILADELYSKALRSLQTCLLVNITLCVKLYSSLKLPITFDEIFRVHSVPFFILDLNLLSCELDDFMLKVLYLVILY